MKGIVFDKDGTLFDFNATWGAWAQDMLRAEVGDDPTRLSALADVLGYDVAAARFHPGSIVIAETVDVVAQAMLPLLPGVTKPDLIDRMKAASVHVPQVPAAPLVPYMQVLRARGLKIGVATNDAAEPAHRHLQTAGILDAVDFVAGYDSGHGAKPGPGQLLAFCAATGLVPGDCAMVGDSLHDMDAGRTAGMVTIGVLSGPAARAELAPAADVVLDTIADIPRWLDANS